MQLSELLAVTNEDVINHPKWDIRKLQMEMQPGPNKSIEVVISCVVQAQQWFTANKWKGCLLKL